VHSSKSDIKNIIDTLREDELLALLGIIKSVRGQTFTYIKVAFAYYTQLCKKYSLRSRGIASFRKYIHQFFDLHLITFQPVEKSHDRFLRIKLTIPKSISENRIKRKLLLIIPITLL